MQGVLFLPFCEKNGEMMKNVPNLTFFVVVKSLTLVYNAIDYAKIYP